MASICPFCKSAVTQALVDTLQCLSCGRLFKFDGTPVAPDPVFNAPANENPDRRYRPGDIVPAEPVVPVVAAPAVEPTPVVTPAPVVAETVISVAPAPVVAEPVAVIPTVIVVPAATDLAAIAATPAPIDLSTLTPEQVASIEAIAHPEV
jgi:hypothetical protein